MEMCSGVISGQIYTQECGVTSASALIENSVTSGVECGIGSATKYQFFITTCCRHSVDSGVQGVSISLLTISVFASEYDSFAIGRKGRFAEESFFLRYFARLCITPVEIQTHDGAQIGITPGCVNESTSIWREGWFETR